METTTFQDLISGKSAAAAGPVICFLLFFCRGGKAMLQPHCTKPYTKGQVTAPAAMGRPPWRRPPEPLRADAVPLRLGVGTWWWRGRWFHEEKTLWDAKFSDLWTWAWKQPANQKWNPKKEQKTKDCNLCFTILAASSQSWWRNFVNSASNQNKHPKKQQLTNWKKNITSTSRLGRVGLAIRCHPPTKLRVVRPSNSSTP